MALSFLRRLFGGIEKRPHNEAEEEDPRAVLGQAITSLELEVNKADASLRAGAAVKRDLELQLSQIDEAMERSNRQAERALAAGSESLARRALMARDDMLERRKEIEASIDQVARQQAALESARDSAHRQAEQLRCRTSEVGARLSAAEAQLRLRQAAARASDELGAVSHALGQLEDRTDLMRARADAEEEMTSLGSGVASQGDALEQELKRLERAGRVERELERLKREAIAERDAGMAGGEGSGEGKEADTNDDGVPRPGHADAPG